MDSFLIAADTRAADAAALPADAPLRRPLPTDDAIALLELFGNSIVELGAGAGVWSALIRARGLSECIAYDSDPPAQTFTQVLKKSGHEAAALHSDHTLLIVRDHSAQLNEAAALEAFVDAGGKMVAYVGVLASTADPSFAATLTASFEQQVAVALPGGADQLTCWSKRASPPPAGVAAASTTGILDVRLELVDMEAPEWAAAQANQTPPGGQGPFTPEIGSRTLNPGK